MQKQEKKPLAKLQESLNKQVIVRLKDNTEYVGKMVNFDSYMNLILEEAKEMTDQKQTANLGRVIIRGNNVLFIRVEEL